MNKNFETELPKSIIQPLFDMDREKGVGFNLGYYESRPEASLQQHHNGW